MNMNALSYLMLANDMIHNYYPTAITIAEVEVIRVDNNADEYAYLIISISNANTLQKYSFHYCSVDLDEAKQLFS